MPAWEAAAIELLVAGLFVEIIAQALPRLWGTSGVLQPSPAERRLQSRFMVSLLPLVLLLVIALIISDWVVAGKAAQTMLEGRLESTAEMTAQAVPYFMETGQNLIQQLASKQPLVRGNT